MQNNNTIPEFTPYEPALRTKEIDLIQAIITRMADNQFKVKGFCITILGFFMAISIKNNISFLIPSVIAIFGCYRFDLKFLEVEKLYRMWFEFLMDKRSETKAWLFEVNPKNIKNILAIQTPQRVDFDPNLIAKTTKMSWAFNFYSFLLFIICATHFLPTWIADASAHFPILSLIRL